MGPLGISREGQSGVRGGKCGHNGMRGSAAGRVGAVRGVGGGRSSARLVGGLFKNGCRAGLKTVPWRIDRQAASGKGREWRARRRGSGCAAARGRAAMHVSLGRDLAQVRLGGQHLPPRPSQRVLARHCTCPGCCCCWLMHGRAGQQVGHGNQATCRGPQGRSPASTKPWQWRKAAGCQRRGVRGNNGRAGMPGAGIRGSGCSCCGQREAAAEVGQGGAAGGSCQGR